MRGVFRARALTRAKRYCCANNVRAIVRGTWAPTINGTTTSVRTGDRVRENEAAVGLPCGPEAGVTNGYSPTPAQCWSGRPVGLHRYGVLLSGGDGGVLAAVRSANLPAIARTQFKLNFPVSMVSRSIVPTSTTVS